MANEGCEKTVRGKRGWEERKKNDNDKRSSLLTDGMQGVRKEKQSSWREAGRLISTREAEKKVG